MTTRTERSRDFVLRVTGLMMRRITCRSPGCFGDGLNKAMQLRENADDVMKADDS